MKAEGIEVGPGECSGGTGGRGWNAGCMARVWEVPASGKTHRHLQVYWGNTYLERKAPDQHLAWPYWGDDMPTPSGLPLF